MKNNFEWSLTFLELAFFCAWRNAPCTYCGAPIVPLPELLQKRHGRKIPLRRRSSTIIHDRRNSFLPCYSSAQLKFAGPTGHWRFWELTISLASHWPLGLWALAPMGFNGPPFPCRVGRVVLHRVILNSKLNVKVVLNSPRLDFWRIFGCKF